MEMRTVLQIALIIGAIGLSPPAMTRGQESGGPREGTPANPRSSVAPTPSTAPPAPQAARPPGTAESTRSLRVPKAGPPAAKGKRWAIVVGIQYTKEERAEWKDRGDIPPLKNAENDAEDVARILREKYGYPEDTVFLLRGKQATREAIANLLLEGLLCDAEKVGPDDSVLFYFSGHGVGPDPGSEQDGEHAYLLPCDAQVNQHARPYTASAIDIGGIAARLRKEAECKARHILLILDCCHSGAVFQMPGTLGGAFEHLGVDESLLSTRSVQAIAASRATQLASDGTGRNSPFTASLLRALQEVPPSLPRERFYFTTNQLYYAMRAYVSAPSSIEQSPQCRWLDGINAGEFMFFPDPNARYDEISDESRRLLLTMVPSTFGNWWPEEMPWFMPGLRLEILANRAESKSTLADEVDKTKLREAAVLTLKRLGLDRTLDEARKRRLGHLQVMLEAEGSADRKSRYLQVIQELRKAIDPPKDDGSAPAKDRPRPEAVDVHYLAVLQQLVGDHAAARTSYGRALVLYEDESRQFVRMQALEALCRSDHGMLLIELNDNDEAYKEFRTARSLFGLGAPIPFRVFCLTKEADARRAMGFTGASDLNMDGAVALAKTEGFDPDETHPLTAAVYNHCAWAKMEQWQFDEAERKFRKTQEILSKPANLDRPECQIDRLHARHGLAMIHRFRGADEEAIRAYADLTREIGAEIRGLERASDRDVNLAEIRALLYDRLVNSLERQADCYLFGRRPDFEAAAFYYRRALRRVGQVPGNRQAAIECDLLYRQAIALFLQSFALGAPDKAEGTESARDFLREQARRVLGQALRRAPGTELDPINILLDREIAEALSRAAKADQTGRAAVAEGAGDRTGPAPGGRDKGADRTAPSKGAPAVDLAGLLERLHGSKKELNRDELERLMFAYRLMIGREDQVLDRFTRLELAERLHEHCRSALRMANADIGVLAYLRPYFDAVLRVKLKHQPVGTKELLELVWEATTGELKLPPIATQPILVMYFLDDRFHLILDVPHGRSGRFEVDPEELGSVDMVKQASESDRTFTCPDGLRKALRAIRLAKGQKLLVHYRDPIHGLGEPRSRAGAPTHVVLKSPSDRPSNPAPAPYLFPFDIHSSLANPSYEIAPIEVIGPLKRLNASEGITASPITDGSRVSSSR